MEADRFQNLKYSEPEFKTESLAVLGEYNKNSSSPFSKLNETAGGHRFRPQHVQAHHDGLPERHSGHAQPVRIQQAVLRSLLPAGVHHHPGRRDIKPKAVRELVDKSWGGWKRGSYKAEIPAEPPQEKPRTR